MKNRRVELLSPARNLEVGLAAINHGADAVYIGPERFGARHAAGNSVADIASLVNYAHRYHAKVYVTLNTILRDDELETARQLIYQLYDCGVDALIVQDMALLEMNIPSIALHSSTQCDNRTLEKVLFLEKCGFEQVVLARETPIETIREITANSNVAIEAFVHGALCVSYSGSCYMSEAMRGRSANRGECTQMCRLPYDLLDADGNVVVRQKHLLSLKDFDASSRLADLVDAGVSSLKIEGRLKEAGYVKNITAYYRKQLDGILEQSGREPASLGKCSFAFTPNPQKTFYRGATTYFLDGRQSDIWSFDTNKSLGEPVGRVRDVFRNSLSVRPNVDVKFANGDGLCFMNDDGVFEGFRINKVENGMLLPLRMPSIKKNTPLFRNEDVAFEKFLSGNSSKRKIDLSVMVDESESGFVLNAFVGDVAVRLSVDAEHISSDNPERVADTWKTQFAKLGDTRYSLVSFDMSRLSNVWFVPVSQLAAWRRELIDKMDEAVIAAYHRNEYAIKPTSHPYMTDSVDFHANVYNELAKRFYNRHGAEVTQMAYEHEPVEGAELMTTRHCIRYAMGWCSKNKNSTPAMKVDKPHEPLLIRNGKDCFRLDFDCKQCVMKIYKA